MSGARFGEPTSPGEHRIFPGAVSTEGLRVLVKVNELGLGGTQINALDFAHAVRAHGVTSTIVGYRETLPDEGPSLLDVAEERGFPVEVLDQGPRGGRNERRRRARELAALADRLEVDLVHTYGAWSARQAYWGPCRLGRRPLVMTVYEMYVPESVYRSPPLVVGTNYLLEAVGARRSGVHLLSPPTDLERDAPGTADGAGWARDIGLADEHLRIVIVSRLADEMKAHGIGVAMQAIAALGRDDVDLIVVGGGEAEGRLRSTAAVVNGELGREAIHFTGAMADPRPAYDGADIMLGMGGSAARTLAFAKPLVVLGEHGASRRFEPESADAIYRMSFWSEEPCDRSVEQLVDELMPLLESGRERDRLGTFGREFAAANFGLEVLADRLVDIYRDALRTYGRTAWLSDWRTEAEQVVRRVRWSVTR